MTGWRISATLIPVGELLTKRRAVDLCRVGSCLCPS
ncbi:MAG: Ms5788A family Cys-rich leader peptide [Mycobacteriales bacterium]